MSEAEDGGSYFLINNKSSYGPFASLRILWKTISSKHIYSAYERPPFPIINETPTFYEVLQSIRFSDTLLSGSIYGSGLIWSYIVSRPFPLIQQRMLVYHINSHMFLVMAGVMMLHLPFMRLTGYWDNGLKWRRPERAFKKYDFTSEFEKQTIFKYFRLNTD